jgi:uncharacterized phiE125 gp8 family phage protein
MSTSVIAPPMAAPVSLAAAKLICRVEHDLEDELIRAYIGAATRMAETRMRRPIITTTFEHATDVFGDLLVLDHPRAAIQWISYIDPQGVQRYLDPQDYSADISSDADCTFVEPAHDREWPDTRAQVNAVRVRYTAGFGPAEADVPQDIRTWVLLHVKSLYDTPGAISDKPQTCMPGLDVMLEGYMVHGHVV